MHTRVARIQGTKKTRTVNRAAPLALEVGRSAQTCLYPKSEIIDEAELRIRIGGAFRVIYVAKFSEAIYVLHAFQKKSRRTAALDLELARSRFKNLVSARASE